MAKVCTCWLAAGWEKELARKVHNTKQNSMAFCDFSTTIHCDNLLHKNTKYHLLPPQLHTQIGANLSHDLLNAYDQYKEKHTSDSESDDENTAPGDGNVTTTAEATACKAEQDLESFVQLLIKLDDKVHEELASHQKEAKDVFCRLKWTGSNAGLSDPTCRAPNVHTQQQMTSQTSNTSAIKGTPCLPLLRHLKGDPQS